MLSPSAACRLTYCSACAYLALLPTSWKVHCSRSRAHCALKRRSVHWGGRGMVQALSEGHRRWRLDTGYCLLW
jgi:hypothetical protein